ncbi:MAG: selenocysteine-specific translation elongation factor [Acidobacteriota bacterium]
MPSPPRHRLLVGTAGHIDHGKTRLVEALTGIDCDRLEEEKARGITIDLGFAHVDRGEVRLSFVDVPGHQRFLPNALAGLGGIRCLLLVVAADEGVKPQTREHLGIARLLGIPAAVIALTKIDAAAQDLAELARLEVEELLAESAYAEAPILDVSSSSGEGIESLFEALAEIAQRSDHDTQLGRNSKPARLPVDRVFNLQGAGLIATGTLAAGSVEIGASLEIAGRDQRVRVRGLQVHGEERDRAETGERTSLQLAGAHRSEISRGDQLIAPHSLEDSRRILVRIQWLDDAPIPLSGWLPVRVHHFSTERAGKARLLRTALRKDLQQGEDLSPPDALLPGQEGWVEILLAGGLHAARGDTVILRRPSPATTLGGGVILDPRWRRRRAAQLPSTLSKLVNDDGSDSQLEPILRLWVQEGWGSGAHGEELARRLGTGAEAATLRLAELAAAGKILALPTLNGSTDAQNPKQIFIDPSILRQVSQRAEKALKDFAREHRLARGFPKAQLLQALLPRRQQSLGNRYLHWLQRQGVLELIEDLAQLPGQRTRLSQQESSLAGRVRERFRQGGLTPPGPAELRTGLKAKGAILDGILEYLIAEGQLLRLPSGLMIHPEAIAEVAESLRSGSLDEFTVAQFRDAFGISRKWAIPILEHLDSIGVTLRDGNLRRLRSRLNDSAG